MSVTSKKIIHFVQYNNFFILFGVGVIMMGSAAFAASPELQKQVYSEKKVARSVDNTYVVNSNFDTYDINLKINNVSEDANKFYVDYTYQTVEITDYMWQQVTKSSSLKVSKGELGSRDLGLYVAMQLGQLADEQKRYLLEVQGIEKKVGLTQKIVATEYTGLVGQFLSTDEKVFDGYTPVKEDGAIADQNTNTNVAVTPTIGTVNTITYEAPLGLSKEQVEVMIQEAVNKIVKDGTSTVLTDAATSTSNSGNASSGNGSSGNQGTVTTVHTDTTVSTSTESVATDPINSPTVDQASSTTVVEPTPAPTTPPFPAETTPAPEPTATETEPTANTVPPVTEPATN